MKTPFVVFVCFNNNRWQDTAWFTVPFFPDSYSLLYSRQYYCCVLWVLWLKSDVLLLRNWCGIHEFDSTSETQLFTWSPPVLSDLRCHLVVCIRYIELCFSLPSESLSFIAYEGEYLLKWLAKTSVFISNKGSFVPYFLFSQSNMPLCLGLY